MKRDNASILVVDDDPALLNSLKEILEAEGYEVTAAAAPPLGVTSAPELSQPDGENRPGRRDGQPRGPVQPDSGAGAGTSLCRTLWRRPRL